MHRPQPTLNRQLRSVIMIGLHPHCKPRLSAPTCTLLAPFCVPYVSPASIQLITAMFTLPSPSSPRPPAMGPPPGLHLSWVWMHIPRLPSVPWHREVDHPWAPLHPPLHPICFLCSCVYFPPSGIRSAPKGTRRHAFIHP